MSLDLGSFVLGVVVCASIAVAYQFGQQKAIRLCRRFARHGRSLDYVFFEDAERDATIDKPKPATADLREFKESTR